MEKTAQELAIKNYFTMLRDPDSLVDADAQKQARDAIEVAKSAGDVVAEARAIEAAKTAGRVDTDAITEAFVAAAKQWADSEGISAQTLMQMGARRDDLARAGFSLGATPRGARSGRSTRRSQAEVKDYITSLGTAPFTTKSVQNDFGGSPATVAGAIEDLQAAKEIARLTDSEVAKLDRIPAYSGRGKTPFVWRNT